MNSAFPATFVATMGAAAGSRKNKARAAKARKATKRSARPLAEPVTRWVTVNEAADILGVSATTVRNRIKSGTLKADTSGGRGNTLVRITT